MDLLEVPALQIIRERLPIIFPDGTEHRQYIIREMAARTIYVMFYVGAVEGTDIWLRPSQVTDMTDEQAMKVDVDSRMQWTALSLSSKKIRPYNTWYAVNSREPIRDETIRTGLIPCSAVLERPGIPTTSSKPKYALNIDFARLFNSQITDDELHDAIHKWQKKYLNKAALSRVKLLKSGMNIASDALTVTFPNGEKRVLAPGPSSVIAKSVIEVFAPKYLKNPAVLWLSESGNKVVARDEHLSNAIGFKIDVSKALPDIILVDLGDDSTGVDLLIVFTEVVATDGPINRERKAVLKALASEAGFEDSQIAFLTAFSDRSAAPFKKAVSELAWGSYAWFTSEPDFLIELSSGDMKKLSS